MTPLISASFSGHKRIVKMLLGAGADPAAGSIADNSFYCGPDILPNALEVARDRGHDACVKALTERRCVVCHATRKMLGHKLRKCGGCRSVVYCGVACQAVHCAEHMPECRRVRAASTIALWYRSRRRWRIVNIVQPCAGGWVVATNVPVYESINSALMTRYR